MMHVFSSGHLSGIIQVVGYFGKYRYTVFLQELVQYARFKLLYLISSALDNSVHETYVWWLVHVHVLCLWTLNSPHLFLSKPEARLLTYLMSFFEVHVCICILVHLGLIMVHLDAVKLTRKHTEYMYNIEIK